MNGFAFFSADMVIFLPCIQTFFLSITQEYLLKNGYKRKPTNWKSRADYRSGC